MNAQKQKSRRKTTKANRRQFSSSAGKTNEGMWGKGATSATGATKTEFVAVVAGKCSYTGSLNVLNR